MDTCIALRTMMVKDGVAYLQAGEFYLNFSHVFFLSTCWASWASCMTFCLLSCLPFHNADLLGTGGGIVFDSDPYEEWVETMNKLGANMQCISSAEKLYTRIQSKASSSVAKEEPAADTEALNIKPAKSGVHVELAAG